MDADPAIPEEQSVAIDPGVARPVDADVVGWGDLADALGRDAAQVSYHRPPRRLYRVRRAEVGPNFQHAVGGIECALDGQAEVDGVEERLLLHLREEHGGPAPAGSGVLSVRPEV